jgi:hypothetical protein
MSDKNLNLKHIPKDEYSELMGLIRFYGNFRFAILTLFIAANAGLLTIIYKTEPKLPANLGLSLKIGGCLVTFSLWIAETSVVLVWYRLVCRAVELEHKYLGFKIWSAMPGAPGFKYLPTTYVSALLYAATIVLWVLALTGYICP